ncbi:expressed unknown protein [Seminavis robusta]|uniref:MYND-type domain-containing protein n=1 Tax=Seminavis robusta TaxID=568900 RepID=A0A9N8HJY0_9STRA|nr:expressed unknown protein [Seminavis robusta]|eukprot:Sro718_g192160.1 n/a (208) ;mRNA; f:11470-12093
MFAAPMAMPAGMLDGGTLTQGDLEDYKRRLGENSPTPLDALQFASVSMRVGKALSDKDLKLYNSAIFSLKEQTPGDRAANMQTCQNQIAELEEKALSCSDRRKEKIGNKRDRKARGGRVRVNASGRKGTTGWSLAMGAAQSGTSFQVVFDDEGPSDDTFYPLGDLTMLCRNCDENASSKCSNCKQVWYCGRDCQKSDWKTHKKDCKK